MASPQPPPLRPAAPPDLPLPPEDEDLTEPMAIPKPPASPAPPPLPVQSPPPAPGIGHPRTIQLYDEEEDEDLGIPSSLPPAVGQDEPEDEWKVAADAWDEEVVDEESEASVAPPPAPGEETPSTHSVPPPFPEVEEVGSPPLPEPPLAEDEAAQEVICPAPEPEEESPWGQVVFVDDDDAQFELARRVQLVQTGWMVNGEVVCGNHTKAQLILPENRIVEDQVFTPCDYFLLKVRGRRGHVQVLSLDEVLIDTSIPGEERYEHLDEITIEVIRRDEDGEEDFSVPLVIVVDKKLPDPRARLLLLDYEDPLAAALVTRGLPARSQRRIDFHGLQATFYDTGEGVVVISDYLSTYRISDGYRPFFVQRGGARFRTAPEDGSDIELEIGDRIVVDGAVYVLRGE